MATLSTSSWTSWGGRSGLSVHIAGVLTPRRPSLSRAANALARHTLTTELEGALRASSAAGDPQDVLRRLDARVLAYGHGERGWDVFALAYRLGAPVDAVVDPPAAATYAQLFAHLWRLRRVARALGDVWARVVGGARRFVRVPGTYACARCTTPSAKECAELEHEWHQVRLVLAEMLHFVRQMEAFCQLEVIACSWTELRNFVNKREGDLDALIGAHRAYLERMRRKILLLGPRAGREARVCACRIARYTDLRTGELAGES
jgi:gamma-tubulin complex component 3